MNAGQFARRLAMIEHEGRRSRKYKSRAISSLVKESGAIIVIMHGKLTGWRLPNGQTVCKKRRYRSELDASLALEDIQAHPMTAKVPRRIYHCDFCHGWHLTSQPAETIH